jgi:hypothetical protein
MSQIITSTLESGQVLTVSIQADYGEIIISTIFLALLVVVVLDFTFQLVYKR